MAIMHRVNNVNTARETVKLLVRTSSDLYGNFFSFLSCEFGDSRSRFCSSLYSHHKRLSDKSALNILLPIQTKRLRNVKEKNKFCSFLSPVNSCQASEVLHKMAEAPKVKLSNGFEMPLIGLGTYESKENDGEMAVKHAIDVGYRHIDTAFFYQNEAEVGKAVRDKIAEGIIKREEIFICTKLWNIHHSPEKVEPACQKSLDKLGLGYIDLYLMHLPVGYAYVNDDTLLPKDAEGILQLSDVDYLDTYKAMEKLVKKGMVRSIGVSNFNSEQIQRVLDNCEIKPVTNQVECHPGLNQKKLIKFCHDRGMVLTAYCPLGRPKLQEKTPEFYFSEKTKQIAEKYKKTPAQIILRYLIEIGTVPIPKSANKDRITENLNVFDFKLTPDEIFVMDSFNDGKRLVPFLLIKGQNHKYFPFNIEF